MNTLEMSDLMFVEEELSLLEDGSITLSYVPQVLLNYGIVVSFDKGVKAEFRCVAREVYKRPQSLNICMGPNHGSTPDVGQKFLVQYLTKVS